MFKVYGFATPNSVRVPIVLEELGLEYELNGVNVRKGEQKQPDFLALNPNGKVPVLVDTDGPNGKPFILTESAAILIYLAEKAGKLIPPDAFGRARVFEQMFFHGTGIGPAMGQVGFFKKQAPEQVPLAINRFHVEVERTWKVLEDKLAASEFVGGDTFTIADIMHFGWMWRREFSGLNFTAYPHIERWYKAVESRPAVQQGLQRSLALVPAV